MNHELPDRYGRTELVLMVVDPFLLFGYWEVTPESLREAQDVLGAEMEGARAVLRFHDISLIHFDGTNAHHTFDIDIGLEARGWYVHLWTAEKSYCADLGFVTRTGRFHAITRSNIVHTPRAGVSARDEERWMRVRFSRRRKPDPRGRWSPSQPPPSGGSSLPRSFAPSWSAACASRRGSRLNSPRGCPQVQYPRDHDESPGSPTDGLSLFGPALPPPLRPASRARALPGGELAVRGDHRHLHPTFAGHERPGARRRRLPAHRHAFAPPARH